MVHEKIVNRLELLESSISEFLPDRDIFTMGFINQLRRLIDNLNVIRVSGELSEIRAESKGGFHNSRTALVLRAFAQFGAISSQTFCLSYSWQS